MNWKSHCLIAFFLSLSFSILLLSPRCGPTSSTSRSFNFSALSALVPDLDHDISKGRKLLDIVAIVLALALAAYFYF